METFKELMARPDRPAMISELRGQVLPIDEDMPLGCVQLYLGDVDGIGPAYAIVTILKGEKVAIPLFEGADLRCRPLDSDRVGYGEWYPFTIFQNDGRFPMGRKPGMIRKGRKTWQLRCYSPEGKLTWAPVPRHFDDHGWPFPFEDAGPPPLSH